MVRKSYFVKQPASAYETMTFGELKVGESFIGLPLPGDNENHGGFTGAHIVYKKTRDEYVSNPSNFENCVRNRDNHPHYMSAEVEVILLK